jgi:hypothetical protein
VVVSPTFMRVEGGGEVPVFGISPKRLVRVVGTRLDLLLGSRLWIVPSPDSRIHELDGQWLRLLLLLRSRCRDSTGCRSRGLDRGRNPFDLHALTILRARAVLSSYTATRLHHSTTFLRNSQGGWESERGAGLEVLQAPLPLYTPSLPRQRIAFSGGCARLSRVR